MRWSDLPFHPDDKLLRQFAGLWLAFFVGLAIWEGAARGRWSLAVALVLLALTIGLLGLIRPSLVRPIFVAWTVLAFPIGWTITQLTLALIFYALVTPLGLACRAAGRDPLNRTRNPDLETYWLPKSTPVDTRRYFNQF